MEVNGTRIRTSEALYQACRFPQRQDLQRLIIEQRSPMTAKMKSKRYRSASREDWLQVRVNVMRWCLRVKLVQNWPNFRDLLLATGERPIVEESRRDVFWGAKRIDEDTLEGVNALGRLLMELRQDLVAKDEQLRCVDAPDVPEFLLYGEPVRPVGPPKESFRHRFEGD